MGTVTPHTFAAPTSESIEFARYWQRLTQQLDAAWPAGIAQFFRALPRAQIDTITAVIGDGQRIRAHLLCSVGSALGGRVEDAVERALAIECIQAASLIHDDYVDQDTVRRRRRATWVVEGPRQAVLLGDIIFATSLHRMAELSRADVLVVAEAIATMAHGAYRELLEPNQADGATATAEIYNNIIYLKTGTLFAAAAKLGAIAAGASVDLCAHAFRFGALVGEAYQIADDMSDVVALENDWHAAGTKLPFLLPALRYFCPDDFCGDVTPGEGMRLQRWFKHESAPLKKRMHQETMRRLECAVNELEAFPENVHTHWLRYAPNEILRNSCT